MSQQNLIFIGPTGAGKTTVGRRVAKQLGLDFVDLDQEIERCTGADIPLIFDIEGEQGFRQRESRALRDACARRGIALATGGGAVVASENQQQMRRCGFVIYLSTPVERQLSRLSRDKRRPLLSKPNREEILRDMARQRNPIYESLADLIVPSEPVSVTRMTQRVLASIRSSDYAG